MGKHSVSFKEELNQIYLVGNRNADRSARNGMQWIQLATDRYRFSQRIKEVSVILNGVLEKSRRDQVLIQLHMDRDIVQT